LIPISATKRSFQNAGFEVLKGEYEKYLVWVLKPVQMALDASEECAASIFRSQQK
jgi:hypothetical protein